MPDKDGDDEKTTKGVVKKKTKQMLNQEYIPEEEYDRYRDNILMRGGDHRSKETRERSNTPTGKQPKGKTVMQKQLEKKYGKGKSALDMVRADHKDEIMDVKKKSKKKANEELDLTKIAEAFGGYLLEKKSPEELAAEMQRRREEKFPKKTKPLSKFERAKQDFEKARSERGFSTGDDPRYKSQESEFDTEGRTKEKTPTQQKQGARKKGKVKLTDDPSQVNKAGPVKSTKIGDYSKEPTKAEKARELTKRLKFDRETPNVEKPFPDPGPDIDDFIEKGPQPDDPQPDKTPKGKSFKVNPKGRKQDRSGKYSAKPAQKGSETEAKVKAKIKSTPNVRFYAPAGTGKPVTGQVKEPTDKQRRAEYTRKLSQQGFDFIKTGGTTAASGGVLPGGKGASDAKKEFNRQQNQLRRLQRQGMADSGATPFPQPPLPEDDPTRRPSSPFASTINPKSNRKNETNRTFKDFNQELEKIKDPSERVKQFYANQGLPVPDRFKGREIGGRSGGSKKDNASQTDGKSQDSDLKPGGGFTTQRGGTLTRYTPPAKLKQKSLLSRAVDFAKKNPATAFLTFQQLQQYLPSVSPFAVRGGTVGRRSAPS